MADRIEVGGRWRKKRNTYFGYDSSQTVMSSSAQTLSSFVFASYFYVFYWNSRVVDYLPTVHVDLIISNIKLFFEKCHTLPLCLASILCPCAAPGVSKGYQQTSLYNLYFDASNVPVCFEYMAGRGGTLTRPACTTKYCNTSIDSIINATTSTVQSTGN